MKPDVSLRARYLSFVRAVNDQENMKQKGKSKPYPPGKKAKKKFNKKKAVQVAQKKQIPQPIINTCSASNVVCPVDPRDPGPSRSSVNCILRDLHVDKHSNVQGPCAQQQITRPFIGQSTLQAVPNESLYKESQAQRGQEFSINQGRKRPYSDGDPGHLIGEGPHVEKIRRISYEDRNRSICSHGSQSGFHETQIISGRHQESQELPRGPLGRKRPYIGNAIESTPQRMRKSVDHTYQHVNELNHQAKTSIHCTNDKNWTGGNKNLSPMIDNKCMIVQKSNAEELAIHELAIVTDNYPLTMLRFDQFDTIQMAVFEKLEATPDPLPVVNIHHLNSMGAIPVTCVGRDSANFLFTFNGQILKGNLKLKVVESAVLPRPIKMMWKSPNIICKDLNRVLRMLQRCNSGLRTAFWKVLRTWLHPQSVRRLVIIDSISAEYIESQNYSIPDGLFRSKFSMFRKRKTSSNIKLVPTKNTSQNTVVAKNVPNPQSCLVPCGADKEKLQPPHLIGGDLECSLYEIRQPLITIDLTEDLPSEDSQDIIGEL